MGFEFQWVNEFKEDDGFLTLLSICFGSFGLVFIFCGIGFSVLVD